MYINTVTLSHTMLHHIRKEHSNVSLSRNPTDEQLAPLGYAVLHPTEQPNGDVVTQGDPEEIDGKWYQTWEVREFTPEEKAEQLAQRRSKKVNEINTAYEAELNAILRDYPEVETKTWDKQESEARAWVADNTATVPLLSEIANARGMTLDDLVPRVIAKADAWIQLSGSATGKRQALEEQVEAATTVEEIEAIQW